MIRKCYRNKSSETKTHSKNASLKQKRIKNSISANIYIAEVLRKSGNLLMMGHFRF